MSDIEQASKKGQFQQVRYNDTQKNGATITFRFPEHTDLDKFRGCDGDTYNYMLCRANDLGENVDDDGVVVEGKSIDDEKADAWDHVLEKKGKIGKECVLAIQTCKDPNFIKYVDDMQYHVEDEYKRTTKEWVLRACGIASRKELDTNEEALKCFRELQACYSVWSAQKGLC